MEPLELIVQQIDSDYNGVLLLIELARKGNWDKLYAAGDG